MYINHPDRLTSTIAHLNTLGLRSKEMARFLGLPLGEVKRLRKQLLLDLDLPESPLQECAERLVMAKLRRMQIRVGQMPKWAPYQLLLNEGLRVRVIAAEV